MTAHRLTVSALAGRTGRGVTVAIVDSGIHPSHPHVGRVTGGAAFDDRGEAGGDVTDRLGHGTAVAGAIHEKAPDVALLAIKVFDRSLRTSGRALVEAIRWAIASRAALVNLSLGTVNRDHAAALEDAVALAGEAGTLVVAAAPDAEFDWLPGALAGVIGVEVDRDMPRDACDVTRQRDGRVRVRASALPRPIPGVPPERNLQGTSFAVANATGLFALAIEGERVRSIDELLTVVTRAERDP